MQIKRGAATLPAAIQLRLRGFLPVARHTTPPLCEVPCLFAAIAAEPLAAISLAAGTGALSNWVSSGPIACR
jgi:hypothetical protein